MENISCPVIMNISPELEYYTEVSITSLLPVYIYTHTHTHRYINVCTTMKMMCNKKECKYNLTMAGYTVVEAHWIHKWKFYLVNTSTRAVLILVVFVQNNKLLLV